MKSNGELLTKDCESIWGDYDKDSSGFLELDEVQKLVIDISEIFFENNWKTWEKEYSAAQTLGKENFKKRWQSYFQESILQKFQHIVDEDHDGKISKEEF